MNLEELGQGYYSSEEINDSIQDAYNEICAKTLCIVKTATLPFLPQNYYDFKTLGIFDYLGTIAIKNNATNLFLFDHLTLRDFDRIRIDWECWQGQPLFWCPHSLNLIAIVPFTNPAAGTFTLTYWATAPILNADEDIPIIASDIHSTFEHYCTADLLETAAEPTKAAGFWAEYEDDIKDYKKRCHAMAKADLSLRV